jgi:transcriptional regulator with XRE-family HTH domain
MNELYKHISASIRDLRNARSLSQEALAKAISEPANTVSRWETGTYKPSAEQLEKLARFFGISITAFFPGMERDSSIPPALLSAMKGLEDSDLDEVLRYAEFRKARATLRAKRKKK